MFYYRNTNMVRKSNSNDIKIGFCTLGNTYPNIIIDGTQIDLIPNNLAQIGNAKIVNTRVDYSSSPWKLIVSIYIDGKTYDKVIYFDV